MKNYIKASNVTIQVQKRGESGSRASRESFVVKLADGLDCVMETARLVSGVIGWHFGHEGLTDHHLVAGIPKVVALFAAGGEITANTGEYLRPGHFAKTP